MTKHIYNLKSDNRFSLERVKLRLRVPPGVPLPAAATNSQYMGYVRNQLAVGKCTGCLKAETKDFLYRKLFQFEPYKPVAVGDFRASDMFAYLTNLIYDGDLGQDAGSSIHTTFLTLASEGVCLEATLPPTDTDLNDPPTATEYAEGAKLKIGAYHFLGDPASMKSCIASGYSFGAGIAVYDSFEGNQLENTGFMPIPASSESLLGYHAQHFMDYDDTIQFPAPAGKVISGSSQSGPSIAAVGGYRVQNSWGPWGISLPGRTDRGTYWMPYDYAHDPNYVSDIWMGHEGKPW